MPDDQYLRRRLEERRAESLEERPDETPQRRRGRRGSAEGILLWLACAAVAFAAPAWRAEVPREGPALLSLEAVEPVPAGLLAASCGQDSLASVVVTARGRLRAHDEQNGRRDSLLVWVPPQRGANQWARSTRRHLGLTASAEPIAEPSAEPSAKAIDPGKPPRGRLEPLTWSRREVSAERTFLEKLPPVRAADDPWFWVRLMSAQNAGHATITVAAPGATGEGKATLTFRLFLPAAMPGRAMEVVVDGHSLGKLPLPGERFTVETVELPAAALAKGSVDVTLRLIVPTGASGLVQSFLDDVELGYESEPVARDDLLVMGLEFVSGAFDARGFSGKEVYRGVRDADGRFHWLTPLRARKGKGGFRVSVADPNSALVAAGVDPAGAELFLFGVEHVATAAFVEREPPPGLLPGAGRVLVFVAPTAFQPQLEPLRRARAEAGWRALVADPRQAYLDRGDGSEAPEALQAWLGELLEGSDVAALTPHVVLVGAASYDPNRHLAPEPGKEGPLVPSFFVDSRHMVTGSDTAFGDLDRDGIPDAAVGRIPATSPAELAAYIDKLMPWEASTRRPARLQRALFAADAEDTQAGLDFAEVARELAAMLPEGVEATIVDQRGEGGGAAFADEVGASMASGVQWVTYVGHGSITSWGRGSAIKVEAVAGLAEQNARSRPAVFVALNCLNAYHVHPSLRSFAEAFLFAPRGGASVYMGSTTLAGSSSTFATARRLQIALAEIAPGTTLGELVLTVRRELAGDRAMGEILRTWILLGDPTQPAPRPRR